MGRKGKFEDPFFDRDDLDNMSDKELLDKLAENRKAVDEWDQENPDPER